MVDVIREHIEIIEGAGGPKARVAGQRIRVQDIAIWHEKLRWSPDEIVHEFPTLSLRDVHAALAYYWDHRDEIERAIAEEEALEAMLKKGYAGPLREKLDRLQSR